MTGAPLPAGADAVVQFEDTDEGARPTGESAPARGATVAIHKEINPTATSAMPARTFTGARWC